MRAFLRISLPLFIATPAAPSLSAALVIIDTFSDSYLNRDIAYPGGTLNIRITGDTNDSFLSTLTGTATASAFHKSAIMLADSDSATTDLRLTFSTPVTRLQITFTDVDADVSPTIAAPTPMDVLIAYEFSGSARVVTSGSNAPTAPVGYQPPNLNVVGQIIKATNTGTSAIATFEFPAPQTFVRINYQNGAGSGSGGVGVTAIRFEAIPEPSTSALAALSALALLHRRRSSPSGGLHRRIGF
jgi:hypothetical protein